MNFRQSTIKRRSHALVENRRKASITKNFRKLACLLNLDASETQTNILTKAINFISSSACSVKAQQTSNTSSKSQSIQVGTTPIELNHFEILKNDVFMGFDVIDLDISEYLQ